MHIPFYCTTTAHIYSCSYSQRNKLQVKVFTFEVQISFLPCLFQSLAISLAALNFALTGSSTFCCLQKQWKGQQGAGSRSRAVYPFVSSPPEMALRPSVSRPLPPHRRRQLCPLLPSAGSLVVLQHSFFFISTRCFVSIYCHAGEYALKETCEAAGVFVCCCIPITILKRKTVYSLEIYVNVVQ